MQKRKKKNVSSWTGLTDISVREEEVSKNNVVNLPPLIGHNFRSSCSSHALRKISFKKREFIYFKNRMKLSTNRLDSFKFYDVLIFQKGNNDYFSVRTIN